MPYVAEEYPKRESPCPTKQCLRLIPLQTLNSVCPLNARNQRNTTNTRTHKNTSRHKKQQPTRKLKMKNENNQTVEQRTSRPPSPSVKQLAGESGGLRGPSCRGLALRLPKALCPTRGLVMPAISESSSPDSPDTSAHRVNGVGHYPGPNFTVETSQT